MTISNNINAANSCRCLMPIIINHKRFKVSIQNGWKKSWRIESIDYIKIPFPIIILLATFVFRVEFYLLIYFTHKSEVNGVIVHYLEGFHPGGGGKYSMIEQFFMPSRLPQIVFRLTGVNLTLLCLKHPRLLVKEFMLRILTPIFANFCLISFSTSSNFSVGQLVENYVNGMWLRVPLFPWKN